MDELTNQRRKRIGVVITAMTAMALSIAVTMPFDAGALVWWLALALIGAAGIGLLLHAWFARVLCGLLFVAGGVLVPMSLSDVLRAPPDGFDVMWMLSVANAIATTLLIVWLCVRGLQVMLKTPRGASVITARIVGGVLAIIAANHLWLAAQIGFFEWSGSWSISISGRGTQLVGFPGWPLWHVALAIAGLLLLAAPRRLLQHAATVLVALFAILVPLIVIAALRTDLFALEIVVFGMTILPAYLAWWLRDELRRIATTTA